MALPSSASPYGDSTILLSVNANGYVAERRTILVQAVQELEPDHWFKDVANKKVSFIAELYAKEPCPTVELIVPTGYRGPVQVDFRIPDDAPPAPGQRAFSYEVSSSGSVIVTGPAILRCFAVPNFTAKYADGRAAASEPTQAARSAYGGRKPQATRIIF